MNHIICTNKEHIFYSFSGAHRMKTIPLGNTSKHIPAIAAGCMRINSLSEEQIDRYINTCIELGITFFDHADIYGDSSCEEIFGKAFLKSGKKREDVFFQSKCGIIPGRMYNLSKEYIVESVENILKRLRTDYLDVFLLHRPDALVEPEEVAESFRILKKSGKVLHFGVSNHKPMQIELLQKYTDEKLVVNQLQLSIPASNMIANGLEVNMSTDGAIDRDGSVLDYCRLHDITIQTWSPFQYGFFEGVFIGNENFPELNELLQNLSHKYNTPPTAVAAAWILRHPAKMQLIAGTTNTGRLSEIAAAETVSLTREEWYKLYLSAGHILP